MLGERERERERGLIEYMCSLGMLLEKEREEEWKDREG
jgi:hypothetical protein